MVRTVVGWMLILGAMAAGLTLAGGALWGGDEQAGPSRGSAVRLEANKRQPSRLRPSGGKIAWGVFDEQQENGKTTFEAVVGMDAAVVGTFQAWGAADAAFDRQWVKQLAAKQQVPLITWEPWTPSDNFDQPEYRMKAIAQGAHDAYVRRWLGAAADWGRPVFVRFAHEMNGNWYPWARHVNTPAEYKAGWRHVVEIAREEGATNVLWVWSPNEIAAGDKLGDYYPGRDYVDWVGMSGFNWGGRQSAERWQQWRPFAEIYGPTLRRLKRFRKPMMIAEIGTIENESPQPAPTETKAAWIRDSFEQIKRNHPPFHIVVWHNDIYQDSFDWRVSTSPESAAAMRTALSDPLFGGRFEETFGR